MTATVLSSTEIQVSWTEVAEIDQNGIITEYEVMYEPLMTFSVLNTTTRATRNLFILLNGLEEYVEYNISVRAYTNDGAGPYSVGIVRRTFEDGALTVGLGKLCFLLTILKKSAYYSSLVYPLFQFNQLRSIRKNRPGTEAIRT